MRRFTQVWNRDAWRDGLTGREVSALDVYRWDLKPGAQKNLARFVRPLPRPWK